MTVIQNFSLAIIEAFVPSPNIGFRFEIIGDITS
jgi:hypothetical protein